ncbi:MAG: hypothetical protein U0984_13185 [Prosthecobacter sp.]|nr:hypothetical protein [Prosthecobacter sp.]
MDTNSTLFFASVLLASATALHAGPRASANYAIATDSADAAGRRATSVNYTNDSSVGGIAGVSSVAAPAETAKQGYIAQLYEVTALNIAAASTLVNEGATRQLSAVQLLDDLTTTAVPAASIAWSVQGGPISGISTGGVATAANVYQNTVATAQGSFAGKTGTLDLTVLNIGSDDFGAYAGDGLADEWQVQYFGEDNADAAPLLDPDGDGHNNHFEFIAGIVPTDPFSVFSLTVLPVAGQPGKKDIIFSPRLTDRTYGVKFSADLTPGSWTSLPDGLITDNGNQRTVTDPNGTGPRKFYRVNISKP